MINDDTIKIHPTMIDSVVSVTIQSIPSRKNNVNII